jgi:hypothetical protein
LAYADDLDLISRTKVDHKEAFLSLVQVAEHMGLKINEDKTSSPIISIGCYNFQKVESFFYLGTVVNSDGGVMMELKARLGAANKCYFGLMKHLSSKLLSRKVKCLIYKPFIRPVLTYGSETWAMGKQGENLLGPLRGKFYGKYLAWSLTTDAGGGAKLKYISSMTNMML